MNSNPAEDEKYMECRRCCAYNLPAMFLFVSSSSDDTDALLLTFDALVSDHYYMVRRTVASGIHEVRIIIFFSTHCYDILYNFMLVYVISYAGGQGIGSKER